jgi:hypothetical protein
MPGNPVVAAHVGDAALDKKEKADLAAGFESLGEDA